MVRRLIARILVTAFLVAFVIVCAYGAGQESQRKRAEPDPAAWKVCSVIVAGSPIGQGSALCAQRLDGVLLVRARPRG